MDEITATYLERTGVAEQDSDDEGVSATDKYA